ncbi:A24 family peptidase [Vibrio marisflavi]|uniref:Prepilin type IV endopeptidase peptidase domain-containing protein n=1 Tax=Vibrio marisflavi CECT 7928 TaxID=634439 RepID=A0ABN8E791_9VIBR|nr:prepilin peptidase [Vibrio marisflavi]CAH0540338.1 hypothetical protein VMF7928_02783 [Vibrio marisflavi CECT 7928]
MKWWLLLAIISLWICYRDITQRTITNKSCIAVLFVTTLILVEQGNYESIKYSLVIFLVGVFLFLIKIIAAGDVKLISAFSLAIVPKYLLLTIVIILLLGGILAIGQVIWIKSRGKSIKTNTGVPYGVPICIGCLFGIAASI